MIVYALLEQYAYEGSNLLDIYDSEAHAMFDAEARWKERTPCEQPPWKPTFDGKGQEMGLGYPNYVVIPKEVVTHGP